MTLATFPVDGLDEQFGRLKSICSIFATFHLTISCSATGFAGSIYRCHVIRHARMNVRSNR